MKPVKTKYTTVSISKPILDDIDKFIKKIGYWSSRGAFVREACIEKIRAEQDRQRVIKEEALVDEC